MPTATSKPKQPKSQQDRDDAKVVPHALPPLQKHATPSLVTGDDRKLASIVTNTKSRQTKTKTKTTHRSGAWSERKEEMPSLGGSPNAAVVALSPAQSPEKKGAEDGTPWQEMGASWGASAEHEKGSSWEYHDLHPEEKEAETGEEKESGTGEEKDDNAGGTGEVGTGEEKDDNAETAEVETGEVETGEVETGDAGTGEEKDGADAKEGGEGKEEEKAPGSWGSDAEFRKALEILAFSAERREDDIKEGKRADTSNVREVGAGVKGSTKVTSTSRKGKTRTTATAQADGMAGVRAAAKTLLVANDDELTAAISVMARAGAFGSAGTTFDARKGRAAIAAEAKASGGIGAQVTGTAIAHADLNALVPALVVMFEFSAQVGAWGEAHANMSMRYRKTIMKAGAAVSGFAGAAAEVKGAAFLNGVEGLGMSMQAGAKAGADGKASGTASIEFKDVGELEIEGGVMAFAGAEAKAKGRVALNVTGIAVEGRAAAFAGARVTAYGKAGAKLRGREVVKVSGKVGVSVGAGAEVGGRFEFINGKLVLEGDIAAVLKGGGETGIGIEIDFLALAVGVLEAAADQYNADALKINQKGVDFKREKIADPDEAKAKRKAAHAAVIDGFQDYAVDIMSAVKKQALTGTTTVSPEKLSKIIQESASRLDLRYSETDRGIEEAAADAFGELLVVQGTLVGINVEAGVVRMVNSISPTEAADIAARHDTLHKVQKVNTALKKDLQVYANKKRVKGSNGVKQDGVQKIVTDHWPALLEAFPGAEAQHATANAVIDTMAGYLGGDDKGEVYFAVDGAGKITKFGKDSGDLAERAESERAEFKISVAGQQAKPAYAELQKKLAELKADVVNGKKNILAPDDVHAILRSAISKVPENAPKDEVKAKLSDVILGTLAPIVTAVDVSADYTIDKITFDPTEIVKLRKGKVDDARDLLLDNFGKELRAKRDTLLKKGLAPAEFVKAIQEYSGAPLVSLSKALDKAEGKTKADSGFITHGDEIAAKANKVLAPLMVVDPILGALVLRSGTSVADEAVFKEERRLVNAKIRGGSEQDNARRALIAGALRKDFSNYGNELRAALNQEIEAKSSGAKSQTPAPDGVDRDRLKKIISARVSKVADDAHNAVGDAAIVDAAAIAFGLEGRDMPGPYLLKKFSVKDLAIDEFEAAKLSNLAGGTEAKRAQDMQEKQTEGRLREAFRLAVEKMVVDDAALTVPAVQQLVTKMAVGNLKATTDEDFARLDAVVTVAATVLGPLVKDFRVDRGIVQFQPVNPSDPGSPIAARKALTAEVREYAERRRAANDPPLIKAVQSCVDAYRNNVGPAMPFDLAHDRLVADILIEELELKPGELAIRGGTITKLGFIAWGMGATAKKTKKR